jgi:serine/threonine protein kinase
MPAPATGQEFIALLRQSALVDEARLNQYLLERRAVLGHMPQASPVASQMLRDGLLTHFQAEQLLQGHFRRFTIGRYKVLDQIGSGGMGSVYLCEHTHMRRRVAVKVLPAAKTKNNSSLERFYREARAVATLNHPNIVRAYDIGEEADLHFLAMEYVEGTSLQDIVKRKGGLEPLLAVQFMRQVALGLQHIHDSQLIHRDIKPGNLLVDLTNTVKILDLGLARFSQDETDDLTVRMKESVLGTIDYLSPEQAVNSHEADARTDIYSLGATFYYCLTGHPPFATGSLAQKLLWIQSREPPSIRHYCNDVPDSLIELIEKAMAKEPEDRFQTAAELLMAIDSLPILTGETNSGAGDRTLTKPEQWGLRSHSADMRRWLLIAGTVALLAAVVGLIALLAAGSGSKSKEDKTPRAKPPAASVRK